MRAVAVASSDRRCGVVRPDVFLPGSRFASSIPEKREIWPVRLAFSSLIPGGTMTILPLNFLSLLGLQLLGRLVTDTLSLLWQWPISIWMPASRLPVSLPFRFPSFSRLALSSRANPITLFSIYSTYRLQCRNDRSARMNSSPWSTAGA